MPKSRALQGIGARHRFKMYCTPYHAQVSHPQEFPHLIALMSSITRMVKVKTDLWEYAKTCLLILAYMTVSYAILGYVYV